MEDLWAPKRRIENRYRRALLAAILRLEEFLDGLDDPIDILRQIQIFTNSTSFDRYAQAVATQMVTHLFTDAGRTWRQAAHVNSQGRMMYEALMSEMQGPLGGFVNFQVQRNAELIKSLPLDIAKHVNEHILTESLKGKRSSDIANELRTMFPEKSKARANLIARTEVGKTSTALTQARSELLKIPAYVWRSSEDGDRVRKSHQKMDRVIVFWDNPPSPEELIHVKSAGHYHAGCIWNCRCYAEPIIDLSLINWPAKVYRYGAIRSMSRKEFERLLRPGPLEQKRFKLNTRKADPVNV
jgi:SPP1 gp7 family putative phage head morphogenesis protein